MKDLAGTWFECKVRYEKTLDNGLQKKVTEQYVVDAVSWTEAEVRITEEMSRFTNGKFEITDIRKAAYKEALVKDNADVWFKAKVQFVTIDEKTEQEKKQSFYYLVNGIDIDDAKKGIDEVFEKSMSDYTVAKLEETAIVEVFFHEKDEKICVIPIIVNPTAL